MCTVLHIEKSERICNLVEDAVRRKGYQYMCIDNFYQAHQILQKLYVDLIIISQSEKDEQIENFLKKINKNIKDNIPILILAGDDTNDKKKNLIDLGVSHYISKGNMEKEIYKSIQYILEEHTDMKLLKEVEMVIIDDNIFETAVEERLLNKYDIYNFDYYQSGKELIESKSKYDVYLVDIVLKNEIGTDIIRNIRKTDKNAVIIAVTSLSNPRTLASILNAGADDYISKPINEDLFMAKLKSNIRHYNLDEKVQC
ncbi:response regulator [Clostridium lundense]|uniref:response regulator n=1 Tax=Clostridium lundense TaxID=319475 RepID=UPI0004830BCB|nr:response regulator [Clostridium lundense]